MQVLASLGTMKITNSHGTVWLDDIRNFDEARNPKISSAYDVHGNQVLQIFTTDPPGDPEHFIASPIQLHITTRVEKEGYEALDALLAVEFLTTLEYYSGVELVSSHQGYMTIAAVDRHIATRWADVDLLMVVYLEVTP